MTLSSTWSKAARPPDRRPIYEWAAERIGKPAGWTRSFDIGSSRHFVEPFEVIRQDHVHELNIMAPTRSGKSLIGEVTVAWYLANDPSDTLWLFQDDDIAKEYAEVRAMPFLKSISEIFRQLSSSRHKTRTQEIVFAGGKRLVIWGPSLGNLQTFGYRLVLCDELWEWKQGTLAHAKARLGDYEKMHLDKLICISQGGAEDDDWDMQFRGGEVRRWHIRCASCKHLMYPHMTAHRPDGSRWGMVFDAQKEEGRKTYNLARVMETLRFECEKCGHVHLDEPRTRAAWNLSGEYVTEGDPNRGSKSYRWPCWIDSEWRPRIREFLKAKEKMRHGNFEDLINFVRKRLAEPKSEKTVHEGALSFARAKVGEEKWAPEQLRTVTADKQADEVYWVTGRQWAKGGESRRILFRRCIGETELEKAVEEVKPSTIQVVIYGRPVNILAVFVDSGYKTTGDRGVYAMCVRHGWAACKGDKAGFFWHTVQKKVVKDGKWTIESERVQRPYAPWTWGDPGEGTAEQGRKHAPLILFSSSTFTDRMQEQIDRGLWVEPDGDQDTDLGREYARQMGSEWKKRVVDKMTGMEIHVWNCPSGNNHARDCGKMQVLVATITELL